MQTKKGSMIEAVINVAVGYGVAVTSQVLVFPLLGIEVAFKTNLLIGLIFTVISLVRQYILRRIFTTYRLFRTKKQKPAIYDRARKKKPEYYEINLAPNDSGDFNNGG